MITEEHARSFAMEWINAWNSHDVEAIVQHYADNIEFQSPIIASLNFNESGRITNKTELKLYFIKGLNAYPDLNFSLIKIHKGTNSIVLHYNSVNGKTAAEVFEFNEVGKVVRVLCNYSLLC